MFSTRVHPSSLSFFFKIVSQTPATTLKYCYPESIQGQLFLKIFDCLSVLTFSFLFTVLFLLWCWSFKMAFDNITYIYYCSPCSRPYANNFTCIILFNLHANPILSSSFSRREHWHLVSLNNLLKSHQWRRKTCYTKELYKDCFMLTLCSYSFDCAASQA